MGVQRRIRHFLHHPATETVVGVLIVASIVLVIIEASLRRAHPAFDLVEQANQAITALFIVELLLRFAAERRKERFLQRTWYDILAVMPVVPALRFLRVLRLLRLFRLGIIATRRLRRFSRAFRVVRVEYVMIALTILTLVLMGGLLIRFAEGGANAEFSTIEASMWYAVMTLIGGEPIGGWPQTRLGQGVTVAMMLSGLTLFAILTGTVSAVMVDVLRKVRVHGLEIDDLHDHVVICGWNEAARLIIEEMVVDPRYKHFVVITEDESLAEDAFIQRYPDQVFTLTGDYTRLDCLQRAGVAHASQALLLADASREDRSSQDRDARTVLAAMLIEKLNPAIFTTVQLYNPDNEASLRRIGVEEIVVSERYVGNIMATVTKHRGIVSMLDELLTAKYGHQFFRTAVPARLVGMAVGEAIGVLKREYDATLLAVDLQTVPAGARSSIAVNPPHDLVLDASHALFIASDKPLDDSH